MGGPQPGYFPWLCGYTRREAPRQQKFLLRLESDKTGYFRIQKKDGSIQPVLSAQPPAFSLFFILVRRSGVAKP